MCLLTSRLPSVSKSPAMRFMVAACEVSCMQIHWLLWHAISIVQHRAVLLF